MVKILSLKQRTSLMVLALHLRTMNERLVGRGPVVARRERVTHELAIVVVAMMMMMLYWRIMMAREAGQPAANEGATLRAVCGGE